MPAAPSELPTTHRTDGAEARDRLLRAALRLFSEKGFARTSTREIAQAATVNLAAIRYYFGGKAGLYSATFTEPMGAARDAIPLFSPPHLSLRQALHAYYAFFVAPLKLGELARQCLRLHIREMLEPTSQWAQGIEQDAAGPHRALLEVLRRHLGLDAEDDDLHRLTFAVEGIGIHLFVAQDIVEALRPALIASPGAIDGWAARLVENALALVAVERRRRKAHAARPPAPARAPSASARTRTPTTAPQPSARRRASTPRTSPGPKTRKAAP